MISVYLVYIYLHPRKLSKQYICFAESYRTIAEEHGLSEEVVNVLTHFISGSSSEILVHAIIHYINDFFSMSNYAR